MRLRPRLDLVAATAALAVCGAAHAQGQPALRPAFTLGQAGAADMAMPDDLGAPLLDAAPTAQASSPQAGADMAMPDDLGAPLGGPVATPGAYGAPPSRLSIDLPIDEVAANPAGRAVLQRDLPGLCERPEYFMFRTMSLRKLAAMSHGRLSEAKLSQVQADLGRVPPMQVAVTNIAPAPHSAFYPLTHTAAYSIHYGGKQIGHFSRALYHRVALVIAAL